MNNKLKKVAMLLVIGTILLVGTAFAADEIPFGNYGGVCGGLGQSSVQGQGMIMYYATEFLQIDPLEMREYRRDGLSMVEIAAQVGVSEDDLVDAIVKYRADNFAQGLIGENDRELVKEHLNQKPGAMGNKAGFRGRGCGAGLGTDGQATDSFRGQARGMMRF